MGCCTCLPSLRFWRKKAAATEHEVAEFHATPHPRPYHRAQGMLDDDEKLPVPLARIAVPSPAAVRPRVDPRYSAYAAPADFKEAQFRRPGTFDSLDTPIEPDSAITPDSPNFDRMGKWKDEGVEDPEADRRRRRAEEARRKAEQEEQERLDFFQML